MIESLACGTPVIAWRNGSVPEVIDHERSGFIVESEDEAVRAVDSVSELSRVRCRKIFEQRFDSERMAKDYVGLYTSVVELFDQTESTRRLLRQSGSMKKPELEEASRRSA
jgi:glycosyltransferase involved in cell wall biosynthesis